MEGVCENKRQAWLGCTITPISDSWILTQKGTIGYGELIWWTFHESLSLRSCATMSDVKANCGLRCSAHSHFMKCQYHAAVSKRSGYAVLCQNVREVNDKTKRGLRDWITTYVTHETGSFLFLIFLSLLNNSFLPQSKRKPWRYIVRNYPSICWRNCDRTSERTVGL